MLCGAAASQRAVTEAKEKTKSLNRGELCLFHERWETLWDFDSLAMQRSAFCYRLFF